MQFASVREETVNYYKNISYGKEFCLLKWTWNLNPLPLWCTEFKCPTTDGAVFQADSTQIEPSSVLHACVHFSWYNSFSVDMAGHDHFLPHPLQEVVHMICFWVEWHLMNCYQVTRQLYFFTIIHCHLYMSISAWEHNQRSNILHIYIYTVELGYNNIGYCDTSPISSNTQWYKLIPHKATVFIPRLVRHSQMHQPRI
jgi:hypothetical protein